jgi:N-acetyl sugar amidotransferase
MNNLYGKYGLPLKIEYCIKCTRSNQRPVSAQEFKQKADDTKAIVPLNSGVCNACHYSEIKKNIDWISREKELSELCDKHRKTDGSFDVLVPGSGGKDSILVAHELKNKYKMNPVLTTWAPNLPTVHGIQNFQAWIDNGFANYMVYQNQKVHRTLTKLAFEELCHPFQPFIIGQKNMAPRLAAQLDIKLIMFGEHDAEFGMGLDKMHVPTMDIEYFTVENFNLSDLFIGGLCVEEIMDKYNFSKSDLAAYLPLKREKFQNSGAEFHFYSYYRRWNFHDNYYYAVENTNFLPASERLEGSYDKYASMDDKIDWLHFYTFYTKFGMGRATAATEQEIRAGVITRDEGISLIKRFDGEFPSKYLKDCLGYMNVTEDKFYEVIEKSRPSHIWKKINGNWALKNPIWHEASDE